MKNRSLLKKTFWNLLLVLIWCFSNAITNQSFNVVYLFFDVTSGGGHRGKLGVGTWKGVGGGGALNKVLFREALPQGPNPYPFMYHFWWKSVYLLYKLYPFHIPTERLLLNFSIEKQLKYLDESAVRCICSKYFESPFSHLNDSFPSPFLYFNMWNPYPFIYLQPEKGTSCHFHGHLLPVGDFWDGGSVREKLENIVQYYITLSADRRTLPAD